MSRIGKQPIIIPDIVTVAIQSGLISVTGPKGTLKLSVPSEIAVVQEASAIIVSLGRETKQSRKLWGTIRALIANMVEGVTAGFEKKLEIEGV